MTDNNKDESICKSCGHTLTDNRHGPDQNDFVYDAVTDKFCHTGRCTYCKLCYTLRRHNETQVSHT